MKKLLSCIAVIGAFLVVVPGVSAHGWSTRHDCNFAGVNCDGTLTDTEAGWNTAYNVQQVHPYYKGRGAYIWAHHRKNASAVWVTYAIGNNLLTEREVCLNDLDYFAGVPYKTTITCHYGDYNGPW